MLKVAIISDKGACKLMERSWAGNRNSKILIWRIFIYNLLIYVVYNLHDARSNGWEDGRMRLKTKKTSSILHCCCKICNLPARMWRSQAPYTIRHAIGWFFFLLYIISILFYRKPNDRNRILIYIYYSVFLESAESFTCPPRLSANENTPQLCGNEWHKSQETARWDYISSPNRRRSTARVILSKRNYGAGMMCSVSLEVHQVVGSVENIICGSTEVSNGVSGYAERCTIKDGDSLLAFLLLVL